MTPQSSRKLLEQRLVARAAARHSPVTIPRAARDQLLPLSPGEQRLWFADQVETEAAVYSVTSLLRFTGSLDADALEWALNGLVHRHESLRTTYVSVDGAPSRVIQDQGRLTLEVVDFSARTPDERELALRALARVERRRRFDLGTGPLVRTILVRLEPTHHVLIVTMHHMVTDGWSMGVFQRELAQLYRESTSGTPAELPELAVQYADFAAWQNQQLARGPLSAQLAGRLRSLDGAPTVLELPTDVPRPRVRTAAGQMLQMHAPSGLGRAVRDLAIQHNATPFMVMLAAFQALVGRLTDRADFLVGTPAAGRGRRELEPLIGFFVNTLVVRADISSEPTFVELLGRVREACLDAYGHQDVPFERLVAELRPEREAGRSPLLQVMFALEPPVPEPIELPGLTIASLAEHADSGLAKFDLTLFVSSSADELDLAFEYSTDLFEPATIQRLANHFCTLLQAIVAWPDERVSTLPLLSDAERHQQLVAWNDTQAEFPARRGVHELVSEQALYRPTAVAVATAGGDDRLTYSQLEQCANVLAQQLRGLGVGRGARVAVCLERSPMLVVCLLAVLKSGGAYVPLDPDQPVDRLRRMLEDAHPRVLIVASVDAGGLGAHAGATAVVRVDRTARALLEQPAPIVVDGAGGDDAAYVMYTSGSSGTPKGVVVPHRAITRLVVNTDYLSLLASDTVAQASNASFDAATFEIWGALVHGARLVVVPTATVLSPLALAETLERERISVLFLTTALFNELVRSRPDLFGSLRCVLFGGEAASAETARRVLQAGPPLHLIHVYGPTETTTFATWYSVERVETGATTLPIGRPIANTRAYVLDRHLQPVPCGVPGELYLGGPGVALGYLERDQLTCDAFVADPFRANPGDRLYKTGDIVRYRADGVLEFLGRRDAQVKLRGFRIEPGEIEARLLEHPSVRQAAVGVRDSASGDKQLVAYIAADPTDEHLHSELQAFLRERLATYMQPGSLVVLEALPLSANGKVDYSALASVTPSHTSSRDRSMARDDVEHRVTAIWRELLGHQAFGIQDNFFDVGGHSLLAARLAARVEQESGHRVPLSTFLGRVSIAVIADLIRANRQPTPWASLVPIQADGGCAPVFAVHGAFGDVLCFAELARELGPGQPVYGLQAVGLDGIQPPQTRIEIMARHYISELRSVQPDGPYHLVGYSSGGSIAFEMAQQLQAAGDRVALLAILDHAPHAAADQGPTRSVGWAIRAVDNVWRNIPYWLQMTARPDEWRAFLTLYRSFLRVLRTRRVVEPSDDAAWSVFGDRYAALLGDRTQDWNAFRWAVAEAQHRAVRAYVPKPYFGPVTVLRANRQPFLASHTPDLGWSAFALGGMAVRTVPGGHHALLKQPFVRAVARELAASIAAARSTEN